MRNKEQDSFSRAVKVALAERSLSVTALAKSLGYARETVSRAIHRRNRSPQATAAIRTALSL